MWQAVAAAELPLHIHVGLVNDPPSDIYAPGKVTSGHAAGDLRFLGAPTIMVQFLNSGVFDRVPDLDVVMVEVDAGWVPYVKEQMDNRFRRRAVGRDARFKRLPSEVIHDHFHFTYITDNYAITQSPPHRRRPADVVERLPALGQRLAEQLAHDRLGFREHPRCRAQPDPVRQRHAAVSLRWPLTRVRALDRSGRFAACCSFPAIGRRGSPRPSPVVPMG